MVTKSTILSKKDAFLLEKAILKYGQIATFGNLKEVFKEEYSEAEVKNRLSLLTKIGWLVRVKRGLFVIISDLSSLSFTNVSLLRISNTLNESSYISLDTALNYYGLFDQLTKNITAITFKRTKKYQFQNFIFKFFKVRKEFYFGFSQKRIEGKFVSVADLEKVILDYLYLKQDNYTLSLVWEKLKDYKTSFDFDKLKDYAIKNGLTIKRKVGFLLDQLNIDTIDLYKEIENQKGYSRFTTSAKDFNNKWRIYYDHRIIK